MPPALDAAWHTHGYYGSVSHDVKAIYQRYMGWYDGNPAHLWQHTPAEAGKRYVAAMGGADAVVAEAQRAVDSGDYRWAAEILNHVLFTEPSHAAARALQADTFEQLGFGAENGTWRSAYLAGATELRKGNFGTPTATAVADLLAALDSARANGFGECQWLEPTGQYWWMLKREDERLELVIMHSAGVVPGWQHVFRAADEMDYVHDLVRAELAPHPSTNEPPRQAT